jgi:hypothetical protein
MFSARHAFRYVPLLASVLLSPAGIHGQVKPDIKKAPKRGGPADGRCPPTAADRSKLNPNAKFGDKDVTNHNDGTLDYFMGSWTYTDKLGNDVRVVKWCINNGAAITDANDNVSYNDYFSYQILTSRKADITAANPDGETERVAAGPGSAT